MNQPLQLFLSVSLPIMVTLVTTIWIAQWAQNKRFDDINRRFDDFRSDIGRRLDEISSRLLKIEQKLDAHEARIVRLEERTSLLRS